MKIDNIQFLNNYFNVNLNWKDKNSNGAVEQDEVSALVWQIIDGVAEYYRENNSVTSQLSDKDVDIFKDHLANLKNKDVCRLVLPNGAILILKADPSSKLTAVGISVQAGSIQDPKGLSGLAHFTEHATFLRSGPSPILQELAKGGGYINAQTGSLAIRFIASLPSENYKIGIDALSSIIKNRRFNDNDLVKEKAIISQEIAETYADPFFALYAELHKLAFPNQPEGRSFVGNPEEIDKITPKDITNFINNYYPPNNIIIAVAGNFEPAKIYQYIKKNLQDLVPRPVPAQAKSPLNLPSQNNYKFKVLNIPPSPISGLLMGYHTPEEAHPDYPGMRILREIIAQRVRTNIPTANFPEMPNFLFPVNKDNFFMIPAVTKAEDLAKVQQAVIAEIDKLKSVPLSCEEIQAAKDKIKFELYSSLEASQGQQELLAKNEIVATSFYEQEFVSQLSGATPQKLLELANKYLGIGNNSTVLVLGQGTSDDILSEINNAQKKLASMAQLQKSPFSSVDLEAVEPCKADSAAVETEAGPDKLKIDLENGVKLTFIRNTKTPKLGGTIHLPKNSQDSWPVLLLIEAIKQQPAFKGLKINVKQNSGEVIIAFDLLKSNFNKYQSFLQQLFKPTLTAEALQNAKRSLMHDHKIQSIDPYTSAVDFLKIRLGQGGQGYLNNNSEQLQNTLAAISLEDLYSASSTIANNKLSVSIVGNAGQAMLDKLQQTLAQKPGVADNPAASLAEKNPPLGKIVEKWAFPFSLEMIGFAGAPAQQQDKPALDILATVLNFRLSDSVRQNEGLAYFVRAANESNHRSGVLTLSAQTQPDKIKEIDGIFRKELSRIRDGEISEAEMEMAKTYLLGKLARKMETNIAQAEYYGSNQLWGDAAKNSIDSVIKGIRKVKLADLAAAAVKYLDPDKELTITFNPIKQ